MAESDLSLKQTEGARTKKRPKKLNPPIIWRGGNWKFFLCLEGCVLPGSP